MEVGAVPCIRKYHTWLEAKAVMLLSLDTMATPTSTKTVQNEGEACHSSFSSNLGPICLSAISLESLLV